MKRTFVAVLVLGSTALLLPAPVLACGGLFCAAQVQQAPPEPIDQNAVSSRQAVVKVRASEGQRGEALKSGPSVRSATSWKRPAAERAKPW